MKNAMQRGILLALLALGPLTLVGAQQPVERPQPPARPATPVAAAETPKEESSVTEHTIRIGGRTIPYRATVGSILLRDDKGEPTALLYYTAYTRSDVQDLDHRPLAFLYNGGPGSSSVWLHMGAFGPRRVVTTDADYTPPPPYTLEDNENSLLDVADLVFIDPVGTGFSHAVGKAKDSDFWGVDEDVRSLAQFITEYVSRNNRWNSPKFLIGESYGTFRSVALGAYLQSRVGMYLNGIVLISSVLDLGTISFHPGQDLPYVFYLPSYAAAAWYHRMLKDRPTDLNAFLTQVRQYAAGPYAQALMKGARLSAAEKQAVARELSRYTGLSEDYWIKANLRVTLPQFMAELQRSRALVTGRLDARFSGPMIDLLSEFGGYDPQSEAVTGAFTAAFNRYIREELKFGQGKTYKISADGAGRQWNWRRQGRGGFGFPGSPNVMDDLVQAFVTNPGLRVEVENGLYDLATPFFATEYTMDHLSLPESARGRIVLKYYEAGHMMYLHRPSLQELKANVARFITQSVH
jgi:carboxypeptidase C (cathepsin A)